MREIASRYELLAMRACSHAPEEKEIVKSFAVPRAFAPPATDQAEEQARFVVMQHLNANAIRHCCGCVIPAGRGRLFFVGSTPGLAAAARCRCHPRSDGSWQNPSKA